MPEADLDALRARAAAHAPAATATSRELPDPGEIVADLSRPDGRNRGDEASAEDAALVARVFSRGPVDDETVRELARLLCVRVVRRDLAGLRAVLAPGVLFVAV